MAKKKTKKAIAAGKKARKSLSAKAKKKGVSMRGIVGLNRRQSGTKSEH